MSFLSNFKDLSIKRVFGTPEGWVKKDGIWVPEKPRGTPQPATTPVTASDRKVKYDNQTENVIMKAFDVSKNKNKLRIPYDFLFYKSSKEMTKTDFEDGNAEVEDAHGKSVAKRSEYFEKKVSFYTTWGLNYDNKIFDEKTKEILNYYIQQVEAIPDRFLLEEYLTVSEAEFRSLRNNKWKLIQEVIEDDVAIPENDDEHLFEDDMAVQGGLGGGATTPGRGGIGGGATTPGRGGMGGGSAAPGRGGMGGGATTPGRGGMGGGAAAPGRGGMGGGAAAPGRGGMGGGATASESESKRKRDNEKGSDRPPVTKKITRRIINFVGGELGRQARNDLDRFKKRYDMETRNIRTEAGFTTDIAEMKIFNVGDVHFNSPNANKTIKLTLVGFEMEREKKYKSERIKFIENTRWYKEYLNSSEQEEVKSVLDGTD